MWLCCVLNVGEILKLMEGGIQSVGIMNSRAQARLLGADSDVSDQLNLVLYGLVHCSCKTLTAFLFCSGRNIYRILFKNKAYERNELFLPGRMAYVVDLDDEYADTDIPTTLIRSKADCPTMEVPSQLPGSLTVLV